MGIRDLFLLHLGQNSDDLPKQPNRLPLSKELLEAVAGELLADPEATYEDFAEIKVMWQVAIDSETISLRDGEGLREKLARLLNTEKIKSTRGCHTSVYTESLESILRCVYTSETESWGVWEQLSHTIDDMQNSLHPQEYDYLVGLITWQSAEIQNAALVEKGEDALLPNIRARNCVTFESMMNEIEARTSAYIKYPDLRLALRGSWMFRITQARIYDYLSQEEADKLYARIDEIVCRVDPNKDHPSKNVKSGDILNSGADIICHQVNCLGVMGAGLAAQIKRANPQLFKKYHDTCIRSTATSLIATTLFLPVDHVDSRQVIANCFAQEGYGRGACQTQYDALEACLKRVRSTAAVGNLSVAIPYGMGCGLAGGDWSRVSDIIDRVFAGCSFEVTIWKLKSAPRNAHDLCVSLLKGDE